jgi:D-alanyl-D-alanine dipeptidase
MATWENLTEISENGDGVALQIAYAGSDNFTGAPIYARPACYLHRDAAACLRRAVELADRIGLRLRVYDAYRPTEAQWRLWAHTPDPNFVADPQRGSPHSRGAAVDLTLENLSGETLEMGTPFDDFTLQSHHGRTDISPNAQRNRILLLGIMTAAGWDYYRNEWWHYQLFESRRYPLLSDRAAGTQMMV